MEWFKQLPKETTYFGSAFFSGSQRLVSQQAPFIRPTKSTFFVAVFRLGSSERLRASNVERRRNHKSYHTDGRNPPVVQGFSQYLENFIHPDKGKQEMRSSLGWSNRRPFVHRVKLLGQILSYWKHERITTIGPVWVCNSATKKRLTFWSKLPHCLRFADHKRYVCFWTIFNEAYRRGTT